MSIGSALSSILHVFETLILSVTSHARLTLASEPRDFDQILKRTLREVKFYSETLLTILVFVENPILISHTLACLLFTLLTYMVLDAMTGETLHKHLNEIPFSRVALACLTKLPALCVLSTLCGLGLVQWDWRATHVYVGLGVVGVGGLVAFVFAVRLRVYKGLKKAWVGIVDRFRRCASCILEGMRSWRTAGGEKNADAESVGTMDGGEKDMYVGPAVVGDDCV